jgi:hypothetical protein
MRKTSKHSTIDADGADAPVDAQKDTRAGETEFASV